MINFTTVLMQLGITSILLGGFMYFIWRTNNWKFFYACCLTFFALMVIAYS